MYPLSVLFEVADDAPLDLPVVGDTPTPEAQRVMLRQANA